MSLKNLADTFVRGCAPQHLGSNIRSYNWSSYLGEIRHNMLGGISYLSPADGKVVDRNDQFTLVKTGAKQFCVVLTDLLSVPVSIGDKVALKFYQLRRFDGTRADGTDDPAVGGIKRMMLTGAKTYFPVTWPGRDFGGLEMAGSSYPSIENPYLRDLIEQMEGLGCDGGYRKVVNILVDANPTNLRFNDSPESMSCEAPPGIELDVQTSKITGHLEINYDRGADTYRIVLTPVLGDPTTYDDICFDELGGRLIDLVDDRAWTKVQVNVIKPVAKSRTKSSAVTA